MVLKSKTPVKGASSKRRLTVRVKAKSRRTDSSRRWLERHLNDPYVAASKEDGYRSRAAYKLIQLDEKFSFLKPGMNVLDLGAAPGGWTQVVAKKIGPKGRLLALDILPVEPLPNVKIMQLDFLAEGALQEIHKNLKGKADLILSDMAPSTTGHSKTDHIRIMALAEEATRFTLGALAPGGSYVCKYFQGGAEKELLDILKKNFLKVKHAKPPASRAESSETYLVALGFRGKN